MKRAQIAGSELEYEVRGSGDPVVLVHGALVADAFAPLLAVPMLTDRHQLILYHRRGYAGSTHPKTPLSIAEQAADCRALMQQLGVKRAHVAGHSYGGAIALQLALDQPEAVYSLVLLEPALLVVPSIQLFMDAMVPVFEMYNTGNKTGAVDAFLKAVVGPEYRNALDREVPGGFAQAVGDADTFFGLEMPALQQWTFTQADAGRIKQPVLAVLGGDSHALWPGWAEIHQLVQAWLPQTKPFVLKGATHGLQMIDPKGTAEAMTAFFARHPLAKR
jgi:pimeloyl-ACP methyl ester carboxylesterase